MKTGRTYSLEWLDSLISVTLNPERPYRQQLLAGDIQSVIDKVPIEAIQVEAELMSQVFALSKESQARHIVRKYHDALIALRLTTEGYGQIPEMDNVHLTALYGIIISCLTDLVNFIEKRFPRYLHLIGADAPENNKASVMQEPYDRRPSQKVLCTLSADQIALILRAADESQILKARSMNAVFKFIIPFLSTPHKENLSAAAVRSKAYNPEEADRDAAVAALHKIIRKIQGY